MPSPMIPIIIGSSRGANGSAPAIVGYIAERLKTFGVDSESFEPISHFNLPFFYTYPKAPKGRGGVYEDCPEQQKWGDYVKAAPALVIALPEYNGGPPANMKLAIDYLGVEWANKPIAVIAYGLKGAHRSLGALKVALVDTLQADIIGTANVTVKLGVQIKDDTVKDTLAPWAQDIDAVLKQLADRVNSKA